MDRQRLALMLKQQARQLGFDGCGIAAAVPLDEDARRLENWLLHQHHGRMSYMERYFDMRVDCRKLLPGSKTVISLLHNYYNNDTALDKVPPKISKYAFGRDYHKVLRKKAKRLVEWLRAQAGNIQARVFVDSGPVLEKSWAARSGLGWIGKNANLINQKCGSFFFLCEIITDLELPPDGPVTDHCGACRACIEACPTQAILPNRTIDAQRCISYLTIELKEAIPNAFRDKMDGWMFGCDVCQDVCPWNRFARRHSEPDFEPKAQLLRMKPSDWQQLDEHTFDELSSGSPLRRAGYRKITQTIGLIPLEKSASLNPQPALQQL
ncbi:MAG: tRNA epoxyqueuosine(34) reductase QueG [Chitinophagales bacterium]|nr:tRNA epoxyqueuosine(34) reductase QueG [Chitinophagales bacterium]MDW8428557.1 tRNA epoxyqueuosine(34) reductase QueG [Chitinophagales bacterium]